MSFIGNHHTRMLAINGDWIDKDGVVHNLDGNVGHTPNKYPINPIPGTYIDSNGEEQNIDTIAIFGGGSGGGGVSMAQVNAAINIEKNARIADDDTERAARIAGDSNLQTQIDALPTDAEVDAKIAAAGGGLTVADVDARILIETNARVADVNAEEAARIAADSNLQTQIDAINSGGGTGGVTQAYVDDKDTILDGKITTEKNDRIAADAAEVTARNTAISNAIAALPPGVTMTQVNSAVDAERVLREAADTAEVTARNTAITNAIATEVTNRDNAIANAVATIAAGKLAVQLAAGTTLTRTINGTTNLANSMFGADFVNMKPGKVIINDTTGTIGIYESNVDAATIQVRTLTIDTIGSGGSGSTDPILLGDVATKAALSTDGPTIDALFGRTANVGDRIGVTIDESQNNNFVEYYITDRTSDVLTYGSFRIINTSQYQAQTSATDAGKVPVIGGTAGLWGTALGFDTTPTAGSQNLLNSDAIATALGNAVLRKTFVFQGDGSRTVFSTTDPISMMPMILQVYMDNMGVMELTGASVIQDLGGGSISVIFNTAPETGQQVYVTVISMGPDVVNVP